MANMKLLLDVVEDMQALANSLHALANTMLQNDAPPKQDEPPIALETVRAALGGLSQDGKTEQVRALLQKYGATKLSGVDPKDYRALLADAEVM